MEAKDLEQSHTGGIYRVLDTIIRLDDVIQGEKQVLLQTDKGSITVALDTPVETVA